MLRRLFPLVVLSIAAPTMASPAPVQDAATDPKCATVRPAFPAGFGGWSTRAPLAAGRAPRNAPVLAVGRGVDLSLHPLAQVQPVAAWGREAAADSSAGLAMFQVARAGTYRVALGNAAWIDVVRAGRSLPSSAHGHGPACTGIRKIVDFRLTPGRYVLQLSGSAAAALPVLIARSEA
ncbi:homogentisate 1,2-dioxygenase [Sphingomonas sp. 36D10-4-7]|uniref:Homogentisate 1,2-dioxygenase n=2 Tax=Sphingomonas corticis TaxID=2722791 RepID=A0ABX1CM30_9SPHN|nr:homogentisate 1,2-dioxygenase [Sphingomonas corticis]